MENLHFEGVLIYWNSLMQERVLLMERISGKPGLDLDEFQGQPWYMVFQHFNLFPNMTVKENIKLSPSTSPKNGPREGSG